MQVHCRTNLDLEPGEIWPEQLDILPPVGSYIISGRKGKDGSKLRLLVASITFYPEEQKSQLGDKLPIRWVAEIELTLPANFVTMDEFDLWYRKHLGRISLELYQQCHKRMSATEEYKKALEYRRYN